MFFDSYEFIIRVDISVLCSQSSYVYVNFQLLCSHLAFKFAYFNRTAILFLFSAKLITFYLVYYSCLAGFFAICIAVFFTTLDKDKPRQQGLNSLVKGNPGKFTSCPFDLVFNYNLGT